MDEEFGSERTRLRQHVREFAEKYLFPYEDECEEFGGLSNASLDRIVGATREYNLGAINHGKDDGGQGLSLMDQLIVNEEWGKATNGVWDVPWRPPIPLRYCVGNQREKYLYPACRGDRRAAYAITEEGAGSDPSMVKTTARKERDSWVISGEKWHVTAGDVADFLLVHAHVNGDPDKPTVFLVDIDLPGVRIARTPEYIHTFVFGHPTFAFEEVRVGEEAILADVGLGYDLTKEWFSQTRLEIGARTMGASVRALELSLEFAKSRVQFGKPIIEFQALEFMLADMATEIMAGRSLLYAAAAKASDDGYSRKDLHALSASVKLYCSEVAGGVIDRAVQIHGGRGCMRQNPVERLYRDLRVDRIWEGTSEIQRSVIGNHLRKRGPSLFVS